MVYPIAALVLSLGLVQDDARALTGRVGNVVSTGSHYQVHVHYEDQAAADLVLNLVESAWPYAMQLLDAKVESEPEHPLLVHLYPSKEEYVEVESVLTRGYFRDTESFAHWDSKTAHVAIAPPLSPGARGETILASQTREVLFHEAAHLALYAVVPTYKWHPTWFAEGFAMSVEFELARRFRLVGDPAQHPRFSTNQMRARRLQEDGRVPSIASILDETFRGLSFDETYALWFEFFRVLRAPGNERRFERLMDAIRTLEGGPGMRANVAAVVREEYGEKRLEVALSEHLAGLSSEWDEVSRSLETIGREWLQCAFPDFDARAWHTEAVGQSTYAIEGRFVLLGSGDSGTAPQMHVLLDRRSASYVAVQFRPGRVSIVRVVGTGQDVLAEVKCPSLAVGEEYAFRVDVIHDAVEVEIDRVTCVAFELGGRQMSGPWGIGVRRGGAGVWRDVRLLR